MISENNIPVYASLLLKILEEKFIFLVAYHHTNANLYKMKINMDNIEGKL